MSDDMWWPWPPTEYFTQKEEFERDLSDQMRRMIADLDRIFPLLMATVLRREPESPRGAISAPIEAVDS